MSSKMHPCICGRCTIMFCVTEEFYEIKTRQAEDNAKERAFYCPNGHQLSAPTGGKQSKPSTVIMPDTREYLEAMTGDKSNGNS